MDQLAAAQKRGSNWAAIRRPEQVPPATPWYVWLIRSGRGWGKTRTGAEWVLERVRQGFKRIALVGQTKADVRDTMIELGESALLNIVSDAERPEYEPSKRRLVWKNGAIATIFSGDEPGQLRGPAHDTAWIDELAKFKYPRETWDNLLFGLRVGADPRCVITTTPKPLALLKEIIARPTTIDMRRSSYENIANLSPVYQREVLDPFKGTRLGRQEIEGEILEDMPGALWQRANIDALRVTEPTELTRIVIAVDPEATSSETSAETGIIVAGLGLDGQGYILRDATLRDTPDKWGTAAVTEYRTYRANKIIAEDNNGGEMVEFVLKTIDPQAAVERIHASRGKQARAEPIAALYEQGKVHHVGFFADLEDQLCSWVPGSGPSPDRLDALVWALTDLMLGGGEAYGETAYAAGYQFSESPY